MSKNKDLIKSVILFVILCVLMILRIFGLFSNSKFVDAIVGIILLAPTLYQVLIKFQPTRRWLSLRKAKNEPFKFDLKVRLDFNSKIKIDDFNYNFKKDIKQKYTVHKSILFAGILQYEISTEEMKYTKFDIAFLNENVEINFDISYIFLKDLTKYLDNLDEIIVYIRNQINVLESRYFLRIEYPNTQNPYLNHYINSKQDFKANIELSKNTTITNNVITISGDSIKDTRKEIDTQLFGN